MLFHLLIILGFLNIFLNLLEKLFLRLFPIIVCKEICSHIIFQCKNIKHLILQTSHWHHIHAVIAAEGVLAYGGQDHHEGRGLHFAGVNLPAELLHAIS